LSAARTRQDVWPPRIAPCWGLGSKARATASCSNSNLERRHRSAPARMRVVATIEDPVVIRKVLAHLGLPTDGPPPRPPPADLFGWGRPVRRRRLPALAREVRPLARGWPSPKPGRRFWRGGLATRGGHSGRSDPPTMRCVVTEGPRAGRRAGH